MSKKLSAAKKKEIRQRLKDELQHINADFSADKGDVEELRSGWQERDSPAEGALRDVEWLQYENIQEQARQIEWAEEKLETGEYGICEGCGEEIPEARLKAIPFARYCILCQAKTETASAHSL